MAGDDDDDEYDEDDESDTYSEPVGVHTVVDRPRHNGFPVAHMKDVSNKNRLSKISSSHLQGIFINPQAPVGDTEKVVLNDSETGETQYGRSMASETTDASGSFADINDDTSVSTHLGAANPIYTKKDPPFKNTVRSGRSVVTLQNLESGRPVRQPPPSPTGDNSWTIEPMPQQSQRHKGSSSGRSQHHAEPTSLRPQRHEDGTSSRSHRHHTLPAPSSTPALGTPQHLNVHQAPTPPTHTPTHTPESSRFSSLRYDNGRNYTPSASSRGRTDLAEDNMMF